MSRYCGNDRRQSCTVALDEHDLVLMDAGSSISRGASGCRRALSCRPGWTMPDWRRSSTSTTTDGAGHRFWKRGAVIGTFDDLEPSQAEPVLTSGFEHLQQRVWALKPHGERKRRMS